MKPLQVPPEFELTAMELDSALWKKLRARLENRLGTYRRQNDGDQTMERTATLRGKIAVCKELLGLDPAMSATDREAGGDL